VTGDPVITVLVVEDNQDARGLMVDALMLAGFEVRAAAHGAEALRMLDRYAPDVIVLDLVLPWVNGLEVLSTLRQKPELRHIPVLVTTGTATSEFDLQVFHPVKVMRKPVSFELLVPAIRRLVGAGAGS
jgi:CheY-like chemotaxis protein